MSTTNGIGLDYQMRQCGGGYQYCNGDCIRCPMINVVYSTRTQTSNNYSFDIHIIKKPE